jgi:adenine-specific DNA-methyltransferase
MRYIGSKVAALPTLAKIIAQRAPDARSLCDPFAGTCTVARHFKRSGLRIVTGDVLQLSFMFQTATVGLNREPHFTSLFSSGAVKRLSDRTTYQAVLDHLIALIGREGYITEHFSPAGDAKRLFFTLDNAMRIDAIRETIAEWSEAGLLTLNERSFLVAALIDAADKVANTAGTYFAHLKRFSRKAAKRIDLVPLPISNNGLTNTCNLIDARELVATCDADILYLDPPYNERDYTGYYHLPETLARWDRPTPGGQSGSPKPPRNQRSDFCSPPRADAALEQVVTRNRSRYILVHCTPNGLISHRRILMMLNNCGHTRFEDLRVRAYVTHVHAGERPLATHRIYWCRRENGAV